MDVRVPLASSVRARVRCRNYHVNELIFDIFSRSRGSQIQYEQSVYYAVIFTAEGKVTYCLGIATQEGLVLASDSRTNAGFDQVNVCRKMYRFVQPGERVFVILTSGSLSISQSVITLLGDDFDSGRGLAQASSLYDAARIVGDCVRRISDIDRASLERDSFSFNVHLLLGGQVRGQKPNLYLIYPQGNPLAATEDSLYLQLGECKYGRPILDRGIQSTTSLEVAAKYALLSLDATMRSNVTVGPPFDLLLYKKDSLQITRYRRVSAGDRDLNLIHSSWEQSLRRAVEQLPDIEFHPSGNENPLESVREVARSRG
jgi:putative proteasome-type protease